jgi:hypothetical protein
MPASSAFLLRLFDIAYESRHTWPLLLSVAFMVADLHFRVEVHFEARIVRDENDPQQQIEDERLIDVA